MPQQARTIALTGATGFVGGHVLRRLLAQGHVVRALARQPERLRAAHATERLEIVAGDLRDAAALDSLLAGAEALVHVAGLVKASRREMFFAVNAEATERLMLEAARRGMPRVVHVSSLAAREPALSSYAGSKHAGEEAALMALGRQVVVVRPPAVYGPGDEATFGLIDQLSRRHGLVPGRKDMRFSLLHVHDLAEALARLAASDVAGGEVLEIDDGQDGGYSWEVLAAEAARVLNRPVRVHCLPRPVVALAGMAAEGLARLTGRAFMLNREKVNELYHPDWVARSPKVQERLDWTPALQFAEGFLDTLRYWCAQGRLPRRRLPGAANTERDA